VADVTAEDLGWIWTTQGLRFWEADGEVLCAPRSAGTHHRGRRLALILPSKDMWGACWAIQVGGLTYKRRSKAAAKRDAIALAIEAELRSR
jgi:hypothetical protein